MLGTELLSLVWLVAIVRHPPRSDKLPVMRPDVFEASRHDLDGFSRSWINHPIHAIGVAACHRSDAVLVNPVQAVKLSGDITFRRDSFANVAFHVQHDDLFFRGMV